MVHKVSAALLGFCLFVVSPAFAADLAAQRQEDLATFKNEYLDIDQSYSPEARKKAEALLAELSARAADMSDARFVLGLAHIAAVSHNGHTTLLNPGWTAQFNRIPLKFLITSDGLFIGGADKANRDLIGKRVVSIDGARWPVLQDAWRAYMGGNRGWRDQFIYYFIESPEILHAAGLAASPDSVTVDYANARGRVKSRRIAARTDLPPLQGTEAYLPPPRALELSREGFGGKPPLYLQDPATPFRFFAMPERNAAYVQFRANADFDGDADISAFAKDVLAKLQAQRPRFIILDERFNLGGDLGTTRDLMNALGDIVGPDGRVFILDSGRTFSAGIASAAYAKQAAGDRAVIIGTAPGDNLEFWAEGDLVVLPNSKAAFIYGRQRHNYMTGCPEPDCHKPIQIHPIRIKTLEPDIEVEMSYADFSEGRDPLLNTAFELIEAQTDADSQ